MSILLKMWLSKATIHVSGWTLTAKMKRQINFMRVLAIKKRDRYISLGETFLSIAMRKVFKLLIFNTCIAF